MGRNEAVIVADVGGTNTRVALATEGRVDRSTVRKYANAGYPALAPLLTEFRTACGEGDIAAACIAVAGPVRDGVGRLTNLDWTVDGAAIAPRIDVPAAFVLNDLVAQGHALGRIAPGLPIVPGTRASGGASHLVVGVGTGFNAAPVHQAPGGRIVVPAEAGHVTLPVRSAEDLALMDHLSSIHGFVGVEDVLSGRGVERIDAFLHGQARTSADIMAAIGAGEAGAEATGRVFVRMLGTVLGDLALSHLPFGGIHLIGGVARAFAPHYDRFGLASAFRDKGRFAPFMQDFSIEVIEDDFAALTGCAGYLASL